MPTPPPPATPDGPRDLRRSDRKRAAILEAATTTFLRRGYLGTSMDEIAALAAVSKQTVYKHFADKEALFTEIVNGTVDQASDPVYDDRARPRSEATTSPPRCATWPGGSSRRSCSRRLLQLRRLVIGEAGRFPELGRTFYERGPQRTIGALAVAFERLAEQGALRLDDPAARRRPLQLAGDVDPAQPGDALRDRRTARTGRPRPLRGCRGAGLPRGLRAG